MQHAAHLERLVLGVVVLYWYLCRLGTRLDRPAYQALDAWARRLSHFTRALELIAIVLGHAAVERTARRRLRRVRQTRFARRPPTPAYRLRYRRHRAAYLLGQTG